MRSDRRGSRRERGIALDVRCNARGALRRQLPVDVCIEIVVGNRHAHLTTFSGAGASADMRRSFSRARLRRDITVPIGTPWTRAISS